MLYDPKTFADTQSLGIASLLSVLAIHEKANVEQYAMHPIFLTSSDPLFLSHSLTHIYHNNVPRLSHFH